MADKSNNSMIDEIGESGFIKISRKILKWEWYSDANTKALFFHCLFKANWKAGRWKGQAYKRGEFITSLSTLSKETGLSVKAVRTALEHLQSTGEVTSTSTSKFRVVTVKNYNKYQDNGKVSGKVAASKGQSRGKQGATDKEYIKNNKEGEENARTREGIPTLSEISLFVREGKLNVNPEKFFSHYRAVEWKNKSGKPIDDWKALVVNWHKNEKATGYVSGYAGIRNLADED